MLPLNTDPASESAERSAADSGKQPNHYEVLGLHPFRVAPTEIARAAAAARDHLVAHTSPTSPLRAPRLAEIVAAESCLSDPDKKRAYDRQLRRRELARPQTRDEFRELVANRTTADSGHPPRPDAVSSGHPRASFMASCTSASDREHLARSVSTTTDDSNNYEILAELGRGENSVVYHAYDCLLQRYVAIKELDPKIRSNPQAAESFFSNARFQAGLQHDNIVRIYGIDCGMGWIIMELMTAGLDRQVMEGPASPEFVRSVLFQALQGLHHLHERNVVHGQVKASNLLIDTDGHVKLSDSHGLTLSEEFNQPPSGMSHVAPELIDPVQFGPVGAGVDLYPLGFLALELLLGGLETRFPCVATQDAVDKPLTWMRWHGSATETLPPLRDWLPDTPKELLEVVERLTRKPVSERYASALDALNDLAVKPIMLREREELEPSTTTTDQHQRFGHYDSPSLAGFGPSVQPTGHARGDDNSKWSKHIALGTIAILLMFVAFLLIPREPGICKLNVDSGPAQATIMRDGVTESQMTPTSLNVRRGESVKLTIDKPGYATYETTLQIGKHEHERDLSVNLKPLPPLQSSVYIESSPNGATVAIDDVDTGQITSTTIECPMGSHVIRLEKPGFEPYSLAVDLTSEAESFCCQLTPSLSPVTITSDPPGAEIIVDGRATDKKTPADVFLTKGKHDIELRLKDHSTHREQVTVAETPSSVTTQLSRTEVLVRTRIETSPSGAEVVVDGHASGTAPCTFLLPQGSHAVVITAKGYRPLQETLDVRSDSPQFHFTLQESADDVSEIELTRLRQDAFRMCTIPVAGEQLSYEDQQRYGAILTQLLEECWDSSVEPDRGRIAAAQQITDADPRLPYVLGLLAHRRRKHDTAIRWFEQARPTADVPFFLPWRNVVLMLLREGTLDKRQRATAKLVELVRQSTTLASQESPPAVLTELASNTVFAGRVVGYLESLESLGKFRSATSDLAPQIESLLSQCSQGDRYVALLRREIASVTDKFAEFRANEDVQNEEYKTEAEARFKWEYNGEIAKRVELGPHVQKPLDPDYSGDRAFETPEGLEPGGTTWQRYEMPPSKSLVTRDQEGVTEIMRSRRPPWQRRVIRRSEDLNEYIPENHEQDRQRLLQSFRSQLPTSKLVGM